MSLAVPSASSRTTFADAGATFEEIPADRAEAQPARSLFPSIGLLIERNAQGPSSLEDSHLTERKERAMPKIVTVTAVILLAILAGYSGATWWPQLDQSDNAPQTKTAPKEGYPDPFIPPTKGNGF
ncbi:MULTISPECIES: hypothetical protein [unclassified Rhizobium]|uniref:hypothetical protein n=1 Tax=unclassified Rhizobium TaxID=2613769 RepID=UPI001C83FC4D|nr:MULTISPECIES: hypothetical protein [unclassified Rhizobium]MBX5222835.1 hypothetical protein [Rhizobium sp. NLR8a]MBX5238920.1 hypothetical protein [Rhizobium sp. NLR22b]